MSNLRLLSEAPEFTPVLVEYVCYSIFSFSKSLSSCPFVLFLLAIVLSVLRFTDSDYPFGIFKLFSRLFLAFADSPLNMQHFDLNFKDLFNHIGNFYTVKREHYNTFT